MESLNLPSILSPDLGLLFWMLLAFLVVFFVLGKYGFPIIVQMVEERKNFIDESLKMRVRQMRNWQVSNLRVKGF